MYMFAFCIGSAIREGGMMFNILALGGTSDADTWRRCSGSPTSSQYGAQHWRNRSASQHPTNDAQHPTNDAQHPTNDTQHPVNNDQHPAYEPQHQTRPEQEDGAIPSTSK